MSASASASASALDAWTKTLTLAISLLPEMKGLSYCTCVFLFCILPLFRQRIAIFSVAEGWLLLDIGWFVLFLWQGLSHGTVIVDLVTFTLKFDLLLKSFSDGFYLVMVAARRASLSSDNTTLIAYKRITSKTRNYSKKKLYSVLAWHKLISFNVTLYQTVPKEKRKRRLTTVKRNSFI